MQPPKTAYRELISRNAIGCLSSLNGPKLNIFRNIIFLIGNLNNYLAGGVIRH